MKKYAIAGFFLALPIFLGACGKVTNTNSVTLDLTNTTATNTANDNANTVANANVVANVHGAVNTNVAAKVVTKDIAITASDFSPSSLTVAAGTIVTWTNNSGSEVRIVSDPHPTHTDLPGLDSTTLAQGATYSFTFTQVGTWGYHDHFSPTTRGTILVQ